MSGRPHGAGVEAPAPKRPGRGGGGLVPGRRRYRGLLRDGGGGRLRPDAEWAEGEVSSAPPLAETLAASVTTGALGALVGAGITGGRPARLAPAAAFATGAAVALLGATLARRVAR